MASRLAWGERGREYRHPDRTDCLVNKTSPVHFISTFFSRKVVFQRGFHDTSSRLAQAFEKNHIKTDFPNFSLIQKLCIVTGIFFFYSLHKKDLNIICAALTRWDFLKCWSNVSIVKGSMKNCVLWEMWFFFAFFLLVKKIICIWN